MKSRFYLHSFGLYLSVDIDFKKRLIFSLSPRENSRGWEPRICEVALINKVLRGQVSYVLAFNPVTSRLKTAAGIPAIRSVSQVSPCVWYSKRKEKRRKCTKASSRKLLCDKTVYIHSIIPSYKGRWGACIVLSRSTFCAVKN